MIDALQRARDADDVVWYPAALLALLGLSPTVALLPQALRNDAIWAGRRAFLEGQKGRGGGMILSGSIVGLPLGLLVAEARVLAEQEGAPGVTEWHVARVLMEKGAQMLPSLGLRDTALLQWIGQEYGRVELGEGDRAKVWCVCDANLFLQFRFFDEVDWHRELGFDRVVLVVPTATERALDRCKNDPNPARERLRRRARQVIPRLDALTEAAPSRTVVDVRPGVDLLALDREPRLFPTELDPLLPDDRIIAEALEFRWTHPGGRVVVVSDDRGLRLAARAQGLECRSIPEALRLRDQGEKVASSPSAAPR